MRLFRRSRQPEKPAPSTLDADAAAWPFTPDSPVLESVTDRDRALSIMLVNLCGLDWPQIENLLPLARTGAEDQDMVPVLVVDLTDLVPLRKTGLAYDALPNVAANSALLPELDWRAYFARRRALLIEKWQPAAIVHLGNNLDW